MSSHFVNQVKLSFTQNMARLEGVDLVDGRAQHQATFVMPHDVAQGLAELLTKSLAQLEASRSTKQ